MSEYDYDDDDYDNDIIAHLVDIENTNNLEIVQWINAILRSQPTLFPPRTVRDDFLSFRPINETRPSQYS